MVRRHRLQHGYENKFPLMQVQNLLWQLHGAVSPFHSGSLISPSSVASLLPQRTPQLALPRRLRRNPSNFTT